MKIENEAEIEEKEINPETSYDVLEEQRACTADMFKEMLEEQTRSFERGLERARLDWNSHV